jgi:hypothetical protein
MTTKSAPLLDGVRNSSVKDVIVDSRIQKVLALRTDSVAMLEALDAISEFYVTNTADTRKMLRQDLELQNIGLAKKFLVEFDQIRDRINGVETLSNNLESACAKLAERVQDADENMKLFMEKASQLENSRNFYLTQSKEIESFLAQFQLSNKEIDLLYHSDIEQSESANLFFKALDRLQIAYKDCKSMVEKHSYSVGFELLEVLGNHQDMAYQHLFDWVKSKCDSLAETRSVEDMETNNKLQIAIRFLKKLPIYFDQCQDLLVNSRRTQLVQKFIVALTQGESNGVMSSNSSNRSLRAIDLFSHDAVRYVGGMLAWMHQAVASEQEFLYAIFIADDDNDDNKSSNGNGNGNDGHGKGRTSGDDDDDDNTSPSPGRSSKGMALSIPELLSRCLQGLGRPLRVRIIQTLENNYKLEVLYSLTDLLTFYCETFNRIVPLENAVHSAVKGCLGECRRLFGTALNKQSEQMQATPVSYPLDLKAAHQTRECTIQIQEILRVNNSALSSMPFTSGDELHVDSVLGNIIQPLLQSCRLGCQSLPQAEMAIFLLNNISLVQQEISAEDSKRFSLSTKKSDGQDVDGSNSWLQLLDREVATWVDILIREEVARTLRRSDLDKLMELIEVVPEGLKAVDQVGLGQDRVGTVLRSFYASLFSTLAPQFERLQDPALRETIRSGTADRISDAHVKIYSFVNSGKNGYDQSILTHSVSEVKVLLGCV